MDTQSISNSVKLKKRTLKIIPLILAIILLFPLISTIIYVYDFTKNINIAFYGIETQATIIENSLDTLGDDLYFFEYEFYDELGNRHASSTKSTYDEQTAYTKYNAGVIQIKYNPETFESVEIPYKFNDSLPIFEFILCGVDIILWLYLLILLIKLINKKRLTLFGKTYIATFSSKDIVTSVEQLNFQLYKISYVWKDEKGNIHEGISKDSYTLAEATAFENAKEFKIKAHRNNSIIISNPNWLNVQSKKLKERHKYYYCVFCGTKFLNNISDCPNCGAPQQETKKRIDL